MSEQDRPTLGMEVIDAADRLVGTVESVEHDHFVVQKGFFFPQSHRLPMSAIAAIEGSEIRLRITREAAFSSNVDETWADQPQHGEIVPEIGDVEKSAARGGVDPHKI